MNCPTAARLLSSPFVADLAAGRAISSTLRGNSAPLHPIFGQATIDELGRHGYRSSAGTLYPILRRTDETCIARLFTTPQRSCSPFCMLLAIVRPASAQILAGEALVKALRQGDYVSSSCGMRARQRSPGQAEDQS